MRKGDGQYSQNQFTPGNGVWFDNGTLRIATHRDITVIRPWGKNAGAWTKTATSKGWKPVRPDITLESRLERPAYYYDNEIIKTNEGLEETPQLVFPFRAVDEAYAWKDFFKCIPDEALRLSRRFIRRQWHILQTLNRCGSAAFDLADCPTLLFLIANNWVYGKRTSWTQRTSRRLCRIKRRKAAGWLGFPDREMTIKILKKFATKSISIESCFYLRNAINDGNLRNYLLHAHRINKGTLRLLAPDTIRYITPNLIDSVAKEPEAIRPKTAYKLLDIIRMVNLLRPDIKRLPHFKDCQNLNAVHNEWVEKLNRVGYSLYESRYLNLEFPNPPDLWVPDGNILKMKPITNPKSLVDLGREHENCVASWAHRIAAGECYIYRVKTPKEMATLAVRKSRGQWKILELKGPGNNEVSCNTDFLVKEWLSVSQGYKASMDMQDFYDDEIPF